VFTARYELNLQLPPRLTCNNSTFCPHSVFMCFVWISEQTAIISLYSINWWVFVMKTLCFLWSTKSIFSHRFKQPHGPASYVQPIPIKVCIASHFTGQQRSGHRRNSPQFDHTVKNACMDAVSQYGDRSRQDCVNRSMWPWTSTTAALVLPKENLPHCRHFVRLDSHISCLGSNPPPQVVQDAKAIQFLMHVYAFYMLRPPHPI
jgi:hypothetical protein